MNIINYRENFIPGENIWKLFLLLWADNDVIGPVAIQDGDKHNLESIAGNINIAVAGTFNINNGTLLVQAIWSRPPAPSDKY